MPGGPRPPVHWKTLTTIATASGRSGGPIQHANAITALWNSPSDAYQSRRAHNMNMASPTARTNGAMTHPPVLPCPVISTMATTRRIPTKMTNQTTSPLNAPKTPQGTRRASWSGHSNSTPHSGHNPAANPSRSYPHAGHRVSRLRFPNARSSQAQVPVSPSH